MAIVYKPVLSRASRLFAHEREFSRGGCADGLTDDADDGGTIADLMSHLESGSDMESVAIALTSFTVSSRAHHPRGIISPGSCCARSLATIRARTFPRSFCAARFSAAVILTRPPR
jgi:hypothetical protein